MRQQGRVDPSQLSSLHRKTENIRNFCILAHVDHGKTTLSDSLVCSNGVISPKLAGKLRFMDSMQEEQQRGITMHSSAISLLFSPDEKKVVGAAADQQSQSESSEPPPEEYLINLVDSPGHIDFSSDVSTATRLCDGALIVVDVLEGLCTQTHAVLFKALKERMRPCLILNKIDRLALEMQLTPAEAFRHLRRIVENVNALASTLLNSELMLRAELNGEVVVTGGDGADAAGDTAAGVAVVTAAAGGGGGSEDEEDDPLVDAWTFSPEKGNVIFASALDCWGFGIGKFANIWAKKFGVNKNVLQKYFFEDCAFNPQSKKIVKCDPLDPTAQPMFATLILDPIWQLYDTAVTQQNPEKAAKMALRGCGVELPPREINIRDPRSTAQAIFRRWLPLSDAVLRMVVRCMPSPVAAQKARLFTLVPGVKEGWSPEEISTALASLDIISDDSNGNRSDTSKETTLQRLVQHRILQTKGGVSRCAAGDTDEVVVFVSKMTPVRVAELSKQDLAILKAKHAAAAAAVAAAAAPPPPTPSSEDGDSSISSSPLPIPPPSPATAAAGDAPEEVLMALARVFSGVLRRTSNLYILGHRHDPSNSYSSLQTVSRESLGDDDLVLSLDGDVPESVTTATRVPAGSFGLYICLGPSVYPVDEVSAGNIVGIVGLEGLVLKTATVASTWACEPMRAITFQAKPMVCVAVEPLTHQDLPKLEAGLQSLYQYDPVVEIGVDDSGQHTMTCLGELHMEQCLKTLIEKFAKCAVRASEPLVAYRETVLTCESPLAPRSSLPPPWGDIPGLSEAIGGRVRLLMSSRGLALTIRCFALPEGTPQVLEADVQGLASLGDFLTRRGFGGDANVDVDVDAATGEHQYTVEQAFIDAQERTAAASLWLKFFNALDNSEHTPDVALKHSATFGAKTDKHSSSLPHTKDAAELLSRAVAVGPKNQGPNILLLSPDALVSIWSDSVPSRAAGTFSTSEGDLHAESVLSTELSTIHLRTQRSLFTRVWSRIASAVAAGFQVVASAGPLMQEPLHGVGFAVEKIEISRLALSGSLTAADLESLGISQINGEIAVGSSSSAVVSSSADGSLASPSSSSAAAGHQGGGGGGLMIGQLISDVKDSLRLAVVSCPVRIVEPVYACDLQCDQSQLGNLYAVLSKRRGQVHKEDIIEGTSLFLLSASLPVAESFGFAQELLKRTSGNGTAPQLRFSHWQTQEEDPFWRPTTAEELEDFGELAAEPNNARACIDKVRKRKGLPVEEKIVVFAEKQRTLNKKK